MLQGSPRGRTASDFRLHAENIPLGRKGNPKEFVSVGAHISAERFKSQNTVTREPCHSNDRVVTVRRVRIIRPIM